MHVDLPGAGSSINQRDSAAGRVGNRIAATSWFLDLDLPRFDLQTIRAARTSGSLSSSVLMMDNRDLSDTSSADQRAGDRKPRRPNPLRQR
jgi:hypothetical protein